MTSSPNGNPSLSTLAYNGYGQTTSITPSGQAADTFSYAGPSQGERTGQGTSGASTSYVNGLTGVQSQATGTSSTLYERDPNGTLLSAQTTTSTTTTSSYFYFDGTGSVIGLLDDTGKQVAKYTYDPYGGHATVSGAEAADTSIATANIWRYARGQYDPATGLTKFGVRYYDPPEAAGPNSTRSNTCSTSAKATATATPAVTPSTTPTLRVPVRSMTCSPVPTKRKPTQHRLWRLASV